MPLSQKVTLRLKKGLGDLPQVISSHEPKSQDLDPGCLVLELGAQLQILQSL